MKQIIKNLLFLKRKQSLKLPDFLFVDRIIKINSKEIESRKFVRAIYTAITK